MIMMNQSFFALIAIHLLALIVKFNQQLVLVAWESVTKHLITSMSVVVLGIAQAKVNELAITQSHIIIVSRIKITLITMFIKIIRMLRRDAEDLIHFTLLILIIFIVVTVYNANHLCTTFCGHLVVDPEEKFHVALLKLIKVIAFINFTEHSFAIWLFLELLSFIRCHYWWVALKSSTAQH